MTTVSPFFTWRRAMTCSNLPSTTKLVLFVIAEYANAMDDICWPSVETIAEKASLSERAVGKHLVIAEESGWLARWKSRRPARRWAHAHYRLSIPESVARFQRDAIEFDLAASESVDNYEPDADDAQKTGDLERRSGNDARASEPRSDAAHEMSNSGGKSESYRNDVPTNKPVNRNTSKPSLYQTSVVSTEAGVQREKPDETASSLAHWMLEKIRARLPDLASPDMRRWTDDVAGMLHVDGRDVRDIARLFAWADADKFWQRVLTEPARLRKNWDEIRRRRNDAVAAKQSRAAQTAPSAVADDRQCAHNENGCRCGNLATTIIGAGSLRRGYCRQHIGHYED